MLPYSMTVDAEINPKDVLNDIPDEDIAEYLQKNGYFQQGPSSLMDVDIMDYYHGDFDLKAFLKKIGLKEVQKIVKEIKEETELSIA